MSAHRRTWRKTIAGLIPTRIGENTDYIRKFTYKTIQFITGFNDHYDPNHTVNW